MTTASPPTQPSAVPQVARAAVRMFLAFALAYFFSALLRAITATLAPTLTQAFALSAADLGLLAGCYFLGFAAMQLPLGAWLDRFGPRRVILSFLSVAVLGCVAFSAAQHFGTLLLARALCGVGVCACLMAPLTAYRRWLSVDMQMRANSWMLMSGSLGMVASTLPVQWLMPVVGWRGIFVLLAALLLVSMVAIYTLVPVWSANTLAENTPSLPVLDAPAASPSKVQVAEHLFAGYREIFTNPYFRHMVPLGFFNYGGMVAMQTLWAGPWLQKVAGYSSAQAAQGLFLINLVMLFSFWAWGWVNPLWMRKGVRADRLMAWGVPVSLLFLLGNVGLGSACGWWGWALYCCASSVVALSQPTVGLAFDKALAGRALSGYNLVFFSGVFVVQWGLGLGIDGLQSWGLSVVDAFRTAVGVFALCSLLAYLYFLWPELQRKPQRSL